MTNVVRLRPHFTIDDGGRAASGYRGRPGDCVVRAIAIASELPYQEVYDEMFRRNKLFAEESRSRVAKRVRKTGGTPRNGNFRDVYHHYLISLGFRWVPTMKIGSGAKVHLNPDELPPGRLVCTVSRHLVAVIDGVIHDTADCSRGGKRCVYGYFIKETAPR